MRLSTPPKKTTEENLVPLINVVFLMLIFFLVAGSLRQFQARGINPVIAADAKATARPQSPILIDAQGQVSLNGDLVELDELAATLKNSFARSSSQTVFIVADRKLDASSLVDLLQTARIAGVNKIRLVAQRRRK